MIWWPKTFAFDSSLKKFNMDIRNKNCCLPDQKNLF